MEIRLLGPVGIFAGGRLFEVGAPQRGAVLAALAVDAGRVVSRQTLIDRVWDEPPARVDNAVYVHVTRLRRIFDQVSSLDDRAVPVTLDRQAGGYLLRLDIDEVDLHRFRRLAASARAPDHAVGERISLLDRGLALWRGRALAGLSGGWVSRMRDGLEQERLEAVLAWAQAKLLVDDPTAILGPLADLAAANPLAESVAAVLMQALSAAGRPGDALDRYTDIRTRLAAELGVDPGPELQAVHRAILRGELARPVRGFPARAVPAPAQLPADVSAFTGRDRELARLDALLVGEGSDTPDQAGATPTALVISAVAGTAGVGKTALAVHWAHRNRDRFPEGQLYANLRGYDPDAPARPAEVLAGFLAALGARDPDIPRDLDGRAALFRTLTVGRRMLVVLDNAAGVEQVRPLLPGSGSCRVLVTSRDRLAGLVAVHGAERLDVDLLPPAEAVALLRRLIGTRVDEHPPTAAALAEQCGRLPLALRVAAEIANVRPDTSLAGLVAELADERRRFDVLDAGGDSRSTVSSVFSWSLRHLAADVVGTFRVLGLHPGPDFDTYATAALADTGLDHSGRALDDLARAHLVYPAGRGRWGMHDLLRAYAARLVDTEGDTAGPAGRRAALTRLFDLYLATAAAAMDQLHPAEAGSRPRVARPGTPLPDFTGPDTARAWLDAERRTLVAVAAHAATHGWPTHAIRLSAVLFRYHLGGGGRYADALVIHGHALEAARRAGDGVAEAHALTTLGEVYLAAGQYGQAADRLQRALDLFQRAGDAAGQARAMGNLGLAEARQGHCLEGRVRVERALASYRERGDLVAAARVLTRLGEVDTRLGRYAAAAEGLDQALKLAREFGDRSGEAWALNALGHVEPFLGRVDEAAENLRLSLVLHRRFGNRTGEAHALDGLGIAERHLDRPARAVECHLEALALFRATDDRDGEPVALNGLGEAACEAGRTVDALSHHAAALSLATQTGAVEQQARAYAGLGHVRRVLGDAVGAREDLARALVLYVGLRSPHAEQVRAEVALVGGAPGPDG